MRFILSIIVIILFFNSVSEAQFTLDAEIRPRSEFRNGFKNAEGGRLFGTYYGLNNYKTLQFLHIDKTIAKGNFSWLLLNNGIQKPDTSVQYTQTTGLNVEYPIGDLQLYGTFYYQGGKDNPSTDVKAYMAARMATYNGLKGSSFKRGYIYEIPGDMNSPILNARLGTEIDKIYSLDIKKNTNLKIGYSQIFGTETLEVIKGGDKGLFNNWAFTMLT